MTPQGDSRPDPDTVDTPTEFVAALRRLQRWSGLSSRQVEKHARDTHNPLPRSTLTAALARNTLPRESIVVALIQACGGDEEEVQRWAAARRRIASAPDLDSSRADTGATPATADPTSLGLTKPVRTAIAVLVMVFLTALAVLAAAAGVGLRQPCLVRAQPPGAGRLLVRGLTGTRTEPGRDQQICGRRLPRRSGTWGSSHHDAAPPDRGGRCPAGSSPSPGNPRTRIGRFDQVT
ncbi:MAG: helix-turn-helix domain-containing protein [Pseudonocardiaceae bacterium]